MKALTRNQYGGAENLRLETLPDPVPSKGQVLVRVLACGLNLSDWEGLTGSPLYARIGGVLRPRYPVLGSDIVGEIIACGTDVVGWQVGQRVWAEVVGQGTGGLATYALLPTARLAKLPNSLDPVVAAALPQPGAIALAATKTLKRGQRVLINGSGGGSGTLALQLARQAEADVTAVDTAAKATLMTKMGATQTIDYQTEDFVNVGQEWDYIVDLFATRPAWKVRNALTAEGQYVMFGGAVSSMLSTLVTPKCAIGMAEGTPDVLNQLGELIEDGAIFPQIETVVTLQDAASALSCVGKGMVKGKIVVVPT